VFFDYDAIVVDPLALSKRLDEVAGGEEARTRAGLALVNRVAQPGEVSLADALRARRQETERLLARGGAVVCFLRPDAVHTRIDGLVAYGRYCWLPTPEGARYANLLRAGTGTEIGDVETAHPFGPFVEELRGKLAYNAYVAEEASGFDATIFARSAGGAAIGVELRTGGGIVVFLPSPAAGSTTDQRYTASSLLQTAIRQALGTAAAGSPPAWVAEYALPAAQAGEEPSKGIGQGSGQPRAAGAVSSTKVELCSRLLWQEGWLGLAEPLRAALALVGFEVLPSDVDAPISIRLSAAAGPAEGALVEIEASEEAVGLDGHYRLRKRIEQALAREKPQRGVLFVNGCRRLPPSERPEQYREAARLAAEGMRYCLATTEQLFRAVRAALEGDEAKVDRFRQRLLATEGILRDE
jgi:hypothetical protein